MKVVALVSGGKDSAYNMLHCTLLGHEIIALANLYPPPTYGSDEMDSFMYQTVGTSAVEHYSQCMNNVPVYRQPIIGTSLVTSLEYQHTQKHSIDAEKPLEEQASHNQDRDETEDLYLLLRKVQKAHPDVEGVSVGAILSTYQRVRVENVCKRLNLSSLSFLWERSQSELLDEIINSGVDARIIKTAAYGLGKEQLGKSLSQVRPKLAALNAQFGVHLCGEGGEYETLVFDSPLFTHKLVATSYKVVEHSAGSSVYYLHFDGFKTEKKHDCNPKDLSSWRDKVAIPPLIDATYEEVINQISVDDDYYKPKSEFMSNKLSVTDKEKIVKVDKVNDFYEPDRTMHIKPRVIVNKKLKTVWIGNVTAPPAASDYPVEMVTELVLEKVKKLLDNIEIECDDETDLEDELQQVSLNNTKPRTKKVSLTPDHVMHVHAFLKNMQDFTDFNNVYDKFFSSTGRPNPPSRVCVENGSLIHNSRVQLSLIATLDSDIQKDDPLAHRKGLHVQSRSYWAPANIGPYSQAISSDIDGFVYLSGQIPLIPATMNLLDESQPLETHSVLSLQHFNRVAAAQQSTCFANLLAYVTSPEAGDAVARTWPGYLSVTSWAGADEESVKHVDYYGHRVNVPLLILQVSGLPKGAKVEWTGTGINGQVLDRERQKYDEMDSDDEEIEETVVIDEVVEETEIEQDEKELDESLETDANGKLDSDIVEVSVEQQDESIEPLSTPSKSRKSAKQNPYDFFLFKPCYEEKTFTYPTPNPGSNDKEDTELVYHVTKAGHQAVVAFTTDYELSADNFDALLLDVFSSPSSSSLSSSLSNVNIPTLTNKRLDRKPSIVSGSIYYTPCFKSASQNGNASSAPLNPQLLEEVKVENVTMLNRNATNKAIGYLLRLTI